MQTWGKMQEYASLAGVGAAAGVYVAETCTAGRFTSGQ